MSIPLYMCNDVMNYGCPAPLSVVKVEKAVQCQLINMCHISGGQTVLCLYIYFVLLFCTCVQYIQYVCARMFFVHEFIHVGKLNTVCDRLTLSLCHIVCIHFVPLCVKPQ